jgi:hypothetical protein
MFSGQIFYDPFIDTLYNIVFTAYPIGWFATYDKQMNYDKLELDPKLYSCGLKNKLFNLYVFWRWYLYATSAGLIIFVFATNILVYSFDNQVVDLWTLGAMMYLSVVLIVNLKILIATNTHNFASILAFLFSIISHIAVVYVLSGSPMFTVFGVWDLIYKNYISILGLFIIVSSCILVEYGWKSVHMILENLIIKPIIKLHTEKFKKKAYTSKTLNHLLEKDDTPKEKDERVPEVVLVAVDGDTHSINMDMRTIRTDSHMTTINLESSTIVNMKGKCKSLSFNKLDTGFAFVEDVANVNFLTDKIKEDFVDTRFQSASLKKESG